VWIKLHTVGRTLADVPTSTALRHMNEVLHCSKDKALVKEA